ncbi:hypothetical protein HAPAU_12830 [Halalkalicoccus paucihalophilus]|uniref:Uncharacterized protein n=1 Tax=Halalkalicoccus paucihalophilus TaxID=1008153 RepID=A0A151AER4_9EURY|nr:glycosyltransferase family 39 protein [Halalkalicoccus paucihalophilus]KYH26188.1 hypothetical protein HAPAU_12830 [Halalkalicoccus paucihalophilus]
MNRPSGRWPDREPLLAGCIAALAAVAVFAVASVVFPYHSVNHDEGVYLQQAAMLLEGQLQLHAGDLAGAFRPWFFVEDGGRLYPKYAPVPAAMYAVSMALFGEPRVTLAAIAGGNALLVYVLGTMAFDRRVGVVAAATFAAAPMTLVTSSVFLPYAPTTLLNLLFAVWYLRGARRRDRRYAAAAGLAIGLAFFARPYTAVLFAAPFIAHALWTVGSALHEKGLRPLPGPLVRNALTAVGGLSFVGLTLAYNAVLTGSPLVFPFAAFAPMDGPGFGRRRILEHAIEYTPALALEANAHVLQYLATRWFTAGTLGTACAACGLVLAARRWREPEDRVAGPILSGLFLTVPLGNVFFWGNFNILATMGDPNDGLIASLGPFYHFDLLVPLSIFAAAGVVAGWRWIAVRVRERASRPVARPVLAAVLIASLALAGAATAPLVAEPIERNAEYTAKYETAYEPIEAAEFDEALVFMPTPYGEWQNHPFQSLRNDPGFDGSVVYALDRDPAEDFAVLDAYPDRTAYRYAYRGEWTPDPDEHVTPKLETLSVRSGDRLAGETTVGVPANVDRATVRLESDGEVAEYGIDGPGERITVNWTLEPGAARLEGADSTVGVEGTEEVVLTVTLVQPDGSTLTYRQETAVREEDRRVEAIAPPERTVCTLVTRCGSEGTYLPENPNAHREGVSFETRIEPA